MTAVDLDAIERTLGTRTEVECPSCEGSGEGPDLSDCPLCLGNCAVAANSPEAMESLARFLLARVRTMEAERGEARASALGEAARIALGPTDELVDAATCRIIANAIRSARSPS